MVEKVAAVATDEPLIAAKPAQAAMVATPSPPFKWPTKVLAARKSSRLMPEAETTVKPKKVAELWAELRHSSPDPDILAEGRIVAAAALADSGDLKGAIAMLATAGATKALRNPSDRHVRQWYLLADLYERAGDVPRAREYFERILRADPEAYDVAERLRGLGAERRVRPKRPRPKATSKAKSEPKAPSRARSTSAG